VKLDFSISLWNYTHYAAAPSLERIIDLVRAAGYGIELWGAWRDEKDLYDLAGRRRLKSALQGMPVSLHTAGAATLDLHKKQIDTAADLGAGIVVLHQDDLYLQGARRTLDVTLAQQAVAYAQAARVRLALENGLLPFLTQAHNEVDGLDFCLDIGHVYQTQDPLATFLAVLKDRLIHLHLQDISREPLAGLRFPGTLIDHYELGAGGIPAEDWRLLLRTLDEIAFEGTAVFEIQPWNPLQTAAKARAFLETL
jgi:sugar phosphate isomerase/epimerase